MDNPATRNRANIKRKLHNRLGNRVLLKYRKVQALQRTLYNRMRYGPSAPRYGELIWVNPGDCHRHLSSVYIRKMFNLALHETRARVIESDWPSEMAVPVRELSLIKSCIDHWVNGVPWKDTGEYERMDELMRDSKSGISHGCSNRDDIVKRYENLDSIFEQARQEGRLRKSVEVSPSYRWGAGEMLVHVGPGGELFKGGEGMHRFAIALILDIPFPAHFSFVHVSAIAELDRLRNKPAPELTGLYRGEG